MNVRTSRNAAQEKAAKKAHEGIDTAAEAINETVDEINDRAAELEAQLRESGERLLETARQFGDIVSRQTKQHPLAACGIAFVAGLAVAKLLRR